MNYCLTKDIMLEYNDKFLRSVNHNKIKQNDSFNEIEFVFSFIKESINSINFLVLPILRTTS